MGPDHGSALLVQTCCEFVEIAGAEAIVPDILLARPDDLQGVGDLFGETNGLLDRVCLKPAPKSSSDEMIVQGHLVDRKSRDPGRVLLSYHGRLSAYPNVAAVRADVNGRIDRLHRRVSQKRKLVFGCHSLRRVLEPGLDVAAFESLDRRPLSAAFAAPARIDAVVSFAFGPNSQVISSASTPGAGGPVVFADDCDCVVDAQDVDYARDLPCSVFLDGFQPAFVHGADRHGRGLHSVDRHIDPVDLAPPFTFDGVSMRRWDSPMILNSPGDFSFGFLRYRQGRGRFQRPLLCKGRGPSMNAGPCRLLRGDIRPDALPKACAAAATSMDRAAAPRLPKRGPKSSD